MPVPAVRFGSFTRIPAEQHGLAHAITDDVTAQLSRIRCAFLCRGERLEADPTPMQVSAMRCATH